LQEWSAFERVSGPILLHERIEVSNAFVAMTIAAANGGKDLKLEQFIPQWDEQPKKEQTPDDIVRVLNELAEQTKRKEARDAK
jgi:DNA transposition AAA+ family ATPase